MRILVFNCGSSSLTYRIFALENAGVPAAVLSGKAHRVGVKGTEPSWMENSLDGRVWKDVAPMPTHRDAAREALRFMRAHGVSFDLVGNRFVHGGSLFSTSVWVGDETYPKLQNCLPLAPLHNPIALSVIDEVRSSLPQVRQYVTFDSAFHATIPACAATYALPRPITERFGFRKYGFHGLSYSWVSRVVSERLSDTPRPHRVVACHLGTGGSSVAAILGGRSIDTSMGYSPLPGLLMSTRCGDIDPMLTVYLMTTFGYQPDDLLSLLNRKSGILGLSGFSSDLTDIIKRVAEGREEPRLALEMYVHRLRKYIGAYAAALGGIDALVFTDSIGVENWLVREKVCERMAWCGLKLDAEANRAADPKRTCFVQTPDSRVAVLTVPTEEELVICLEGDKLLKEARHAPH